MKFLNREQEAAINSATDPEVIKALIHQAAEHGGVQFARSFEQHPDAVNTAATNGFARSTDPLQRRDPNGRFVAAQQEAELKRTVTINGKQLEFTDSSEAGLANQISQAQELAKLFTAGADAARTNTVRPETDEQRVMRQTELELQFKRGQISTQEYLEKSGAIAEFMESHGAPLDQIVQTVQEAQAQQETQSWADVSRLSWKWKMASFR
jgi:hypothetical protein